MIQTDDTKQINQAGSAYLTVLKWMEIACYSVALIITFVMFAVIFQINVVSGIALVLSLILATVVLKGRLLFWFMRNHLGKKSTLDKQILSFKDALHIVTARFSRKTMFLIGVKLFVFNVLAEIFPLILITLLSMMLFVFGETILFATENYTVLFNWGLAFFGVIGVLLALFQHLLSSQRKSIKETLEKIHHDIRQRVQQETDYHKFRNWVLGKTNLENKKKYVVSAGAQSVLLAKTNILTELILAIIDMHVKYQDNDKVKEGIRKDLKNILPKMNLTIQSAPLSSSQRYMDLDAGKYDIKYNDIAENLHTEYKEYFLDICFKKIMDDIKETYDLPELGSLFLSNINLINEEGNTFIKMNTPALFWQSLDENDVKPDSMKFESANEYIIYLEQKIIKSVTLEMFRPYLNQSFCQNRTPDDTVSHTADPTTRS